MLCVPDASCADLTRLLFLFRSPLEVLLAPYKALPTVSTVDLGSACGSAAAV